MSVDKKYCMSSYLAFRYIEDDDKYLYLIRELMAKKYPDIPVPFKNPMPRPVDKYFKDWKGPVRKECKKNLDMTKYTGNQKWQLWCLERFLNNNEG